MVDRSTIAKTYRDNAARCRRLAQQTTDRQIAQRLLELAEEFDEHAPSAEKNQDEDEKGLNPPAYGRPRNAAHAPSARARLLPPWPGLAARPAIPPRSAR